MPEYAKGLVSVVIPTYKRSKMLERAIESVFGQTYTNLEILLVNDNNPNDEFTAEIQERIKKYVSDSRLQFIIQEKHVNGAVARNVGIKRAKGEYVAFLDDDDWWEKDKIEKQIKTFSKLSKEYGVISCKAKRFKEKECFEVWPKYPDGNTYKDILLLRASYPTGSLLFRHTALDVAGYFDETLLRHQDLQLLINFTYRYKIYVIDEYLLNIDVSDASNRPNPEKLIQAKKAFFKSVSPIYRTLSYGEQRQVMLMHKAEIGYIYLKNRQVFPAFMNLLGLLASPTAFRYEIIKVREKRTSQRNARLQK